MGREIEIKLPLADVAEGKRRLRGARFRVSKRRVLETNVIFDTMDHALRTRGCLLRVREAGRHGLLTFKGPVIEGPHKDREELETEVADAPELSKLLQGLEFVPAFHYEKYRTEYQRPGERGVATLDETPVGVFLELEGSAAWIDRNARRLGFAREAYITGSYYGLYLDYCRERGVQPGDMTFAAGGSGRHSRET